MWPDALFRGFPHGLGGPCIPSPLLRFSRPATRATFRGQHSCLPSGGVCAQISDGFFNERHPTPISASGRGRLSRIILFCLPVWAAVACSGGTEEAKSLAAQTAPTVLRISQGSDLLSLDPYFKLESPSFCIQRNIFDALTDYDENIKVVPCLAETWELKKPHPLGVQAAPGGEVPGGPAADGRRRRLFDPPGAGVASIARQIRNPDDQTRGCARYRHRPDRDPPSDAILPLRLSSILILDRESSEPAIKEHGEDWLATHANGTGPYRLKLWRKDERCELVANENFWGKSPRSRNSVLSPLPTTRRA